MIKKDLTFTATHRATSKRGKQKSMSVFLKRYAPFYIMFIPVFLYYIIFCYAPMVGVIIAFKDFNFSLGIFGSGWVGFKHFSRFLGGGDFLPALTNTIYLSFLRISCGFPAPIILALCLNSVNSSKFKRFVQTATYLPHFISWVVIYGLLYNIFSMNGIVNITREALGFDSIVFLGRSEYFRALYVGSAIWKEVGWSAIIYLAALAGVDVQLYEAATIDGATSRQKLWHITLPSIRNTICVMFILQMGNILNVGFEQIMVMYNNTVSNVAEVLDYYIYRVGLLQANNYSYATAVGLFRSAVAMCLVIFTNYASSKIDEGGSIW